MRTIATISRDISKNFHSDDKWLGSLCSPIIRPSPLFIYTACACTGGVYNYYYTEGTITQSLSIAGRVFQEVAWCCNGSYMHGRCRFVKGSEKGWSVDVFAVIIWHCIFSSQATSQGLTRQKGKPRKRAARGCARWKRKPCFTWGCSKHRGKSSKLHNIIRGHRIHTRFVLAEWL